MARLDDAVSRGLAKLSLVSSRYAKTVLLLALLLTGIFAFGVSKITTNVDVADVLPRGNYNTDAAHALTSKFRSTFTQQVTLQLHVDEAGAAWETDNAKLPYRGNPCPPDASNPGPPPLPVPVPVPIPIPPVPPLPLPVSPPTQTRYLEADSMNITDEVYVRAMQELVDFVQARTDFSRAISINNIYALLNWTVAGGEDSAPAASFALPGYATVEEACRYVLVDQVTKNTVLDTVDALASPTWRHAAALFMPAADNSLPTAELGRQMLRVRDEYVQWVADGHSNFTVFGPENPPLFTVDLPIANAHSSDLVRQDTAKLLPMILAFIVICLWIAFRNARAILVSFSTLVLGVVWSYGTMGYMGIALNTLNMTIVPLVIGVGIDYSIHIINEFVEHKSQGHTDEEAFRISGARSGLAMLIATATTIGGLAVLIVSPSLLIAQLGVIACVALTVIYLLAISYVPAALTLIGGSAKMGESFRRSRLMPALARGVTKARFVVLVVIVIVSGLAYVGTQNLHKEAFGDPGKNYLPGDPIRQEHEKGLAYFYDQPDSNEKANILTFEGDGILTPQAMEYYRTIEANLKTKPRVIPDTLRTLPFFIETWLTVKGGPQGALTETVFTTLIEEGLPAPESFPQTEADIRREINGMFTSPMKELSSIILNHPRSDMAAMTFSVRAASYEEAEAVWHQVWGAVGQANLTFGGHAPPGIRVAFVGNTATNYLFIAEELPWLEYMNIVGNIILAILVFAMTRSIKITFVTLLLSTLTSLWWLALLPSLGIGLAITLVLPLAFIIAIGTDWGIHFMWNIRQVGDAREVFASTGKAVLFSAITTTGAFSFFILLQNVAVSRTMLATTISFGVIFLATMLLVPVFFHVRPKGARLEPGGVHGGEAPLEKVGAPLRPAPPHADQGRQPKPRARRRPKPS